MRISDWSSDVCSSDLSPAIKRRIAASSNESRIRRFSSLVRTILPGPALAVGVLQHVSLDRLGHRGRQDVAARQLLGMTSHGRRRQRRATPNPHRGDGNRCHHRSIECVPWNCAPQPPEALHSLTEGLLSLFAPLFFPFVFFACVFPRPPPT